MLLFVRNLLDRHPARLAATALSLLTIAALALQGTPGWAQTKILQAGGDPFANPRLQAVQAADMPGKPAGPEGKPKDEQTEGAEAEKGNEKPKEKPDAPPTTIERPNEPSEPPDAKEFEVRPDTDQRIAFSFRNQPWVAILEWFAEISDSPLDWRELPADHVNIASSGRYTLDEVRDLLNRYLLARGFVMLRRDDGLMVLKTEGINPALVPRVSTAQLATLQPHEFVRTSLDVGWLSAEKLATELKPMISANGTLVAMTSTNRIEAMDAAINLLQVSQLLEQERSPDARRDLAPEFQLRYISASEAKTMLEEFLGMGEKEPPMSPQQMQMMQQMRMQQGGEAPPQPAAKKPEISIVANPRRNSIVLHAPPDRIAVATEFLNRVDVPSNTVVSLADIESRVEVFRLASLDPEKLLEIIQGMNIIEPTTQLQVDEANQAIIVSGSGADRYIVRALIERLDGSARQFYVLPIRYRDPRAVAESILFLVGDEKKDDSKNRRPYYYWGGGQQDSAKDEDKFRVAADVRFKQILLWANEYEMEDVHNLLIKLGELPPPGGSRSTVRVLDASPTPETYQYLQRLREQFRTLAPNPIELPAVDQFPEPNVRPSANELPAEDPAELPAEAADVPAEEVRRQPTADAVNLAMHQTDPTQTIRSGHEFDRLFGDKPPPENPPAGTTRRGDTARRGEDAVRIEVDAEGRILLISPDTEALDQLENLMLKVPPPKRPYEVFYIQHASAYWMELNLTSFFEDDAKKKTNDSNSFMRWMWDLPAEEEEQPGGLGASQPLKFVSDDDTNTVIVTGATSPQLRTIGELIELWDVPEPVNKRKARYTKLVPVMYSRAEKIAETVKDAYRDLLSSNDKAFQQKQGNGTSQQGGKADRNRGGNGSELVDQGGKEGGGSDFTFKGKLSVGVDEVGNTLLVSAEGEPLLDLVVDMILQLDAAAKPQGDVQVHRTAGSISVESLEAALQAFTDSPGRRPSRQTNSSRPSTATESNDSVEPNE